MKRILVTGVNSYIGNQFAEWVRPYDYSLKKISLRGDEWKKMDWSDYDVILHVAGIAHNSSNSKLEDLYYKINRDLTLEVANKAKKEGVGHFINMSSIIVFGTKHERIGINTVPKPDNFYGDSKLQAEIFLDKMSDDNFAISHIRPPMVYGNEAKGNFPLLVKVARKTPFFPSYDNKRSMIYIKNLSEFIRLVIDNNVVGKLHPQNVDYVKTSELVSLIAKIHNHNILSLRLFNPIIRILSDTVLAKKIFGDLYYSKDMDDGKLDYRVYSLNESIIDMYMK